MIVDTHAHLYVQQFEEDIEDVIARAVAAGVEKIYLPNINVDSIDNLFNLCDKYPQMMFPMLGLHPGEVKANYREELSKIEKLLDLRKIYAIGEIGTDAYWDKTYLKEQEDAFNIQCQWAIERNLPIVIHARDSLDWQIDLVEKFNGQLSGIFHCFTGNADQAQRIIDNGFYLGIGGVVTFKNGGLDKVLNSEILSHLVLETDSPYLAPTPYRGKRNESAYLANILKRISEVIGVSEEEVERVTTLNADKIFN
ncbi:TatD family hydrolase [Membranihabitans marinus]|uniref:TatD family hydrolase n=1 Tax=Membranihabitans marinus TaxID=1227546 RepID=UPI001F1B8D5E|nr:TatD family hydrolase [Membranihabitans marinus]